MRVVAALVGALAIVAAPSGAASRITLPTPAEAAALPRAVTILGVKPGEFPNKAPGPITGSEIVRVDVDDRGKERAIVVDQTLVIHGVGDFTLEVPGPALSVAAPAGSNLHPGLRRGSLIWEGFSPGSKTLRATVTLDTEAPSFRTLPLRAVAVVDRRPRHCIAGPCGPEVRLSIKNTSVEQRTVRIANARAGDVGALLDAIRASLAARAAPIAGRGRIPSSLDATGSVTTTRVDAFVPMRVHGSLTFTREPSGERVTEPFERDVLDEASIAVPLHGDEARDIAFSFIAEPTLPAADRALPPAGARSWSGALASAQSAKIRSALLHAQGLLWSTLRKDDGNVFLGNPLGGASTARYEYRTFVAPAAARAARGEEANVFAIALALLGMIAVASGAVAVWRRL